MRAALAPVLLLTAASIAAAAAPSAPAKGDLVLLSRKNELLRQQLDLAKAKEFYILLDPQAQKLTLMYRAALLQQYKVEGIEVGLPRIAYRTRTGGSRWEGRIWEKGTLDPARALDRVEVQAPPPTKEGTEVPVQIPQTPEEKYPVPARYHIRFAGGLSLEVRPPGTDEKHGFWGRLGHTFSTWWADAKSAARPAPSDTVRLHVVMSKQDAESLYRALPPDTKLLVLPRL